MTGIVCLLALSTNLIAAKPTLETVNTDMRSRIEQFQADENDLLRVYGTALSENCERRLAEFYSDSLKDLASVDFDHLSLDEKVDYTLLRNHAERAQRRLQLQRAAEAKFTLLIPFYKTLSNLDEARQRMEPLDSEKAAASLTQLVKTMKEAGAKLGDTIKGSRFEGNQALKAMARLREALRGWYEFYNGYDPVFSWWNAEPYKSTDAAIGNYMDLLKTKIIGIKADDVHAIVGEPIGRDGLMAELKGEMITYSPEELIGMADQQYAWCLAEMKKASHEMGFGDDWKAALEKVKTLHVVPGEQPAMIKDLALEAIKFVEDHDLLTVPRVAKESWQMIMMSPERQLVSPFFLGGQDILVSYPTDTMTHDQKMMSMRGNNRYFSRATVQHELIPGHHMQDYVSTRYKPYRSLFYTPFWIEGWALYWEMLLWDMKFPAKPEEKVGMLFWRMHRCARITFSLKFHLGQMTPEQCVDYLVEKVGHERANAEGEVRRSFGGDYDPLYQIAYMIGGLQFRELHKEFVDSGKMTNKQFHDTILHESTMPVEMVRALLMKQAPSRDFTTVWKFGG